MVEQRVAGYAWDEAQSLPTQGQMSFRLPIQPVEASQEASPLMFQLWVTYEDELGQALVDGPFSFAAQVFPSYVADLPPAQPVQLEAP